MCILTSKVDRYYQYYFAYTEAVPLLKWSFTSWPTFKSVNILSAQL